MFAVWFLLMSLIITTQPAEEPVSLDEARAHLRVTGHRDDMSIKGWIQAARLFGEARIGRQFITATLRYSLDRFPMSSWPADRLTTDSHHDPYSHYEIRLPSPRLIAVTSVKYYDTDGVQQTLDPSKYQVDNESEPGRIRPAYGEVWPTCRVQMQAVQFNYTAGYGLAAAVPATIKAGMLLVIGHLYENREETTEQALASLPLGAASLFDCEGFGNYVGGYGAHSPGASCGVY